MATFIAPNGHFRIRLHTNAEMKFGICHNMATDAFQPSMRRKDCASCAFYFCRKSIKCHMRTLAILTFCLIFLRDKSCYRPSQSQSNR